MEGKNDQESQNTKQGGKPSTDGTPEELSRQIAGGYRGHGEAFAEGAAGLLSARHSTILVI